MKNINKFLIHRLKSMSIDECKTLLSKLISNNVLRINSMDLFGSSINKNNFEEIIENTISELKYLLLCLPDTNFSDKIIINNNLIILSEIKKKGFYNLNKKYYIECNFTNDDNIYVYRRLFIFEPGWAYLYNYSRTEGLLVRGVISKM
jgi:hypothetical protein